MRIHALKPVIWVSLLLIKAGSAPAWAEVRQENLIGCWSAAYEYDSLSNIDGSPKGSARLCSRGPSSEGCGHRGHLEVTYCFDRGGNAYGAEAHCWSGKEGRVICHGSDGLSGSYRLQGNRMDFFRSAEENDEARELAWSCAFSISEHPDVLEFADCTRVMKTFFRDCDLSQKNEEYRTKKCELTPK
jgi:hypothetical protein